MTNTDTQDAARVAPAAELLSEQVNALVPADTRAYLLGSVEADGARGEGAVIRALLSGALKRLQLIDADEFRRRVELGRAEMGRRRGSGPAPS